MLYIYGENKTLATSKKNEDTTDHIDLGFTYN
jgi:hypothetical protein